MERSDLRLVRPGERSGAGPTGRVAASLLGLGLLAAAAVASGMGAGAARARAPAVETAEQTIAIALQHGNRDPRVRAAVVELRAALGRRPLEGETRVVYASLLLLARDYADRHAANFHAGLAARLAPVTVPVVGRAALVLARGGEEQRALELVRGIFGYDPAEAADLLLRLELLIFSDRIEQGVPPTPTAWAHWGEALRAADRHEEADLRLEQAWERWPADPRLRLRVAAMAVREGDAERLQRLFPEGDEIADGPHAAALRTYRARARAARGDSAGARADLTQALDGEPGVGTCVLAGDAWEAIGDAAAAKRVWNRALFRLPAGPSEARLGLLVRLARLEDRDGEPAAALRLWRAVLELEPTHAVARRRVEELSGLRR